MSTPPNHIPEFRMGDRVQVSSSGGWRTTFPGTVCSHPEPVRTLQGDFHFYWVEFDTPQACIDDEDEYIKAQILSCYLTPLELSSN